MPTFEPGATQTASECYTTEAFRLRLSQSITNRKQKRRRIYTPNDLQIYMPVFYLKFDSWMALAPHEIYSAGIADGIDGMVWIAMLQGTWWVSYKR